VTQREQAPVFGRYELQQVIGRGGVATVYRAYDPEEQRVVALKVLRDELINHAELRALFEREARLLCGLHHPHIVACSDMGEAHGLPFFVMECLEGPTLFERIRGQRRTGQFYMLDQALELLRPLVDALTYLHGRGIVHRDLKPENIVLTQRGPVIADFGSAMRIGGTLDLQLGTIAYMAPEQLRRERCAERTDVYALGILLYELLTGQPPFIGADDAVVQAHLYEGPPALADLNPALSPTPELEEAAYRALAKDPADRWQSAQDFLAALETAAQAGRANGLMRWLRSPSTGTASRAGLFTRLFMLLTAIALFAVGLVVASV
jgi:serine/threonine-protein kinase